MHDTIAPLVDSVLELSSSQTNLQRIQGWIAHNNDTGRGHVFTNVHLWKHSDHPVWHEIIPEECIRTVDPIERDIACSLYRRLYKFQRIPDFDVIFPTIWVSPVLKDAGAPYGLSSKKTVGTNGTEPADNTLLYESVITCEDDLNRMHEQHYEIDEAATERLVAQYQTAVDGMLPVKVCISTNVNPFDDMTKFRSINELMYDTIDAPQFIHQMMEFFTSSIINKLSRLEAGRWIDPESTWDFRVHADSLPCPEDRNILKNCWTYLSDQSACVLSPDMYEEFIFPYHARLSELFGKVYFHGCEDLTKRAKTIKALPKLNRFHISPWSDARAIIEELGQQYVYEIHVHTANHLLTYTEEEQRKEIKRLVDIAKEYRVNADINLSDIETVVGDPEKLIRWAEIAQSVLQED